MVRDIDLLNLERGRNTDYSPNGLEPRKPRRKKKTFKFFSYLAAIGIVALFLFTSHIITAEDNSLSGAFSFLSQIGKLAKTSENMLKGEEENDRVNILLLGMGGTGHEGGLLTDTIMLASIMPSTGEVALLSIPRDMVVPIDGYGWRKVNHINAYAEMEKAESGGLAVSQSLSQVLGMPIDYYLRLDFYGFEKVIDELGGIEVEVDNLINDTRYPILGQEENEDFENRFQHLYIEPGLQKMDGSLALKYARSRHSAGIEGSDFARSRRQQKVLKAVKDEILSMNVIFKPRMVTNILKTLNEHIDTNFKVWEIAKLWSIVKNTESDQITTKTLDNSIGGFLVDVITEDGAYVLEPSGGNFDEIQYFAKNIFTNVPPQQKQQVIKEYPKLEIQNGTWVNGLAQRKATNLEKFGFDIVRLGNADKQNYERSIIFDLTYGEKMDSLTILKERTNAKVNYGLPDWMINELKEKNEDGQALIQPDFILILGQAADETKSGIENSEE